MRGGWGAVSVYSILDMQPRTLVTHAMLDENFSKLILTVICAARSVPLSPCGLKKKNVARHSSVLRARGRTLRREKGRFSNVTT